MASHRQQQDRGGRLRQQQKHLQQCGPPSPVTKVAAPMMSAGDNNGGAVGAMRAAAHNMPQPLDLSNASKVGFLCKSQILSEALTINNFHLLQFLQIWYHWKAC